MTNPRPNDETSVEDVLHTLNRRHDLFWQNVSMACSRLMDALTVDEVFRILGEHFEPSSEEAFFESGAGDSLMDLLDSKYGWKVAWAEAGYFFTMEDRNGDRFTYIEGDVKRGDR